MNVKHKSTRTRRQRERGAVAILAMMFLVIFASLAAAMAIVAQGNLSTADAHLKINRSLAAAETGMRFINYRLALVAADVKTTDGLIDGSTGGNAEALWQQVIQKLTSANYIHSMLNEAHNIGQPTVSGKVLSIGPIAVSPGGPQFTATLTPHPITGENYGSSYYKRAPFSTLPTPVSAANPLDASWIRVKVVAADGPPGHQVQRAIQMELRLKKVIPFAILSKSRVMIGRNVMINGPVGSRFMEVNLPNGHPVQMVSDFRGVDSTLDANLDLFVQTLATNDVNGDNRIDLQDSSEVSGIGNAATYDRNGDHYIDDYDFFLARFDSNGDGAVSVTELGADTDVSRAQLIELIDTSGDPSRPGYNDGVVNQLDRYAKIRGEVYVGASLSDWVNGAANGSYQPFFEGGIVPKHNEEPLTFDATNVFQTSFGPSDFDVSSFRAITEAGGSFADQVADNAANYDPNNPDSPKPPGATIFEAVPYGAAHPYDFYDRPVYENMTFTNVKIPKGTNALFKNCKFVGCTFVESETNNFLADPDDNTRNVYGYAGMQEADGTKKYPDLDAAVGDPKTTSNNLRFDSCTFEGAIITDPPQHYTNTRNKISFTGKTAWNIETSSNLTADQKELYRRSVILAPHYSIELGTFVAPSDSNQTVNLSGTIVAGVLDMRGQVEVRGTILTTFEPVSNTGPVVGNTSPQFNTTLGYFPSAQGDLEAELPANGIGVIHLTYDENIPLPDGILGPISLIPQVMSYYEVAP